MFPTFQEYLYPFLKLMGDGKVRNLTTIMKDLGRILSLTDEDLQYTYESSGQNKHSNQCSWAKTWTLKAGLIQVVDPKAHTFSITTAGLNLLSTGITSITRKYLVAHYPTFAEFAKHKKNSDKKGSVETSEECMQEITPLEKIESAYEELTLDISDNLIKAILAQTPKFFEELVVKLLVAMGYGGDFEDAAKVTQLSGDGGIDGVIKEDALGLDKIYIQAKRWSDKLVGAPDIHQFIGALTTVGANKGVYITTSTFTEPAKVVAQSGNIKVILIDGEQLARYMLKYNVGVVTSHSFEIKRIDVGFFNPE